MFNYILSNTTLKTPNLSPMPGWKWCRFLDLPCISVVTAHFTPAYEILKSTEAMTSQKLFLHFSVLDTMYRWSMMKNIHSPNLVGIASWGPKIWLHEYLISPIEISVNWPGSKVINRVLLDETLRYSRKFIESVWRYVQLCILSCFKVLS